MSSHQLPSLYQHYIHLSRYARYDYDKERREFWNETVNRYFNFFQEHLKTNFKYKLTDQLRKELESAVLDLRVMPSMRAMTTAGPALERDHIAAYNCSYIPIDRVTAFDEVLYILMNGTGVGFSVERQYTNQLGTVADEFHDTDITIMIADSKMGWAKGLKELILLLYGGQVPSWDTSKVRPAGSPLKTFGGRSSGPEPLEGLFAFVVAMFKKAAGRKLTSLECHDLVCKIAEIVIVGGVRRAALISLSNLSDDRMRNAKMGQWWMIEPQRALANNSAAYTDKPEPGMFMKEWLALYESKSGERGIFNRQSAKKQSEKTGRRDVAEWEYGTNPCGEIILRPNQFCNLSEVIIRTDDTLKTLKGKVRIATILGTFQSTLTDFKYISKKWQNNCDEERLLGVSFTGIMDHPVMSGQEGNKKLIKWLGELKQVSIETNTKFAKALKINRSAAISCVKPSGNISQLTNTSSGIHARWSKFYLRTVRAAKSDPLSKFMIDAGFYAEPDQREKDKTWVFYFPIASPEGSTFAHDVNALDQMNLWKIYHDHWCEHNPSCTVYLKNGDWIKAAAWVYENFDDCGGMSFLPYDGHVYQQAPYQPINEAEYNKWTKRMPANVDWSKLEEYETGDMTAASQELACTAGACEI